MNFKKKKKHSTTEIKAKTLAWSHWCKEINERKKKVFLFHSEFDLCFFFVKDGFVFSALKNKPYARTKQKKPGTDWILIFCEKVERFQGRCEFERLKLFSNSDKNVRNFDNADITNVFL